jgi:hypothetical protein
MFFLDFGWDAVLLTGTVITIITLPVLGFIPVETIKTFLKSSPIAVTKPAIVILPAPHETKAEEMLTVQEDSIIEEILTEQVVPAAEKIISQPENEIETEIPLSYKVETETELTTEAAQPVEIEKPGEEKSIPLEEHKTEEVKPQDTKKPHVKRTPRHKTAPKSGVKKPVVHKTKKKSP